MPDRADDSFAFYRSLDLRAEAVWPPARLRILAGWRCRLDRGVTRRANSVLAAGWRASGGSAALSTDLEAVEKLYLSSELPPCFQIMPHVQPAGLDDALAARSYRKEGESLVQCCDLEGSEAPGDVELSDRPSAGWLAQLSAGGNPAVGAAKAAILARAEGPKVYAALGPEAAPKAIGIGLRAGDTAWVNSMYTRPDVRGQGLAGRILAAIAHWSLEAGLSRLDLQVEKDKSPARHLYERFGFRPLYPYHYRCLAPSSASRCGAGESAGRMAGESAGRMAGESAGRMAGESAEC